MLNTTFILWCIILCPCNYCVAQNQSVPPTEVTEVPSSTNASQLEELDLDEETVKESDEEVEMEASEMLKYTKSKEGKYEQRSISQKEWQQIISDKEFIYTLEEKEKEKKIEKEKPKSKASNFNWNISEATATFILYALVALVIVLIFYAFFGKQYFNKKDKKIEETAINFEEVETFNEWEKAIRNALAEGNFKLATRILFLQTLQKMNDVGIIKYNVDKANSAYLQKLYSTNYYKPFANLVRYFDYTWYGEYTLTAEQYQIIQQQFYNFHTQIDNA